MRNIEKENQELILSSIKAYCAIHKVNYRKILKELESPTFIDKMSALMDALFEVMTGKQIYNMQAEITEKINDNTIDFMYGTCNQIISDYKTKNLYLVKLTHDDPEDSAPESFLEYLQFKQLVETLAQDVRQALPGSHTNLCQVITQIHHNEPIVEAYTVIPMDSDKDALQILDAFIEKGDFCSHITPSVVPIEREQFAEIMDSDLESWLDTMNLMVQDLIQNIKDNTIE